MKQCKDCLCSKPEDEFYGVQNECKDCTKKRVANNPNAVKYDKTEKGVIRIIYKTQRSNSKRRKHDMPTYTKDELKDWIYKNGFKALFDNWVNSGYKRRFKPSVDRIDDFKGYSMQNIQLGTVQDNINHQVNDILTAKSVSGRRCKAVECIDKDGKVIAEYVSRSEACRAVGYYIDNSIYNGSTDRKNGFKWKYKEKK